LTQLISFKSESSADDILTRGQSIIFGLLLVGCQANQVEFVLKDKIKSQELFVGTLKMDPGLLQLAGHIFEVRDHPVLQSIP
jgi:hypothetical protein